MAHVVATTISAMIVFLVGCMALSRGRPSEPFFALSVILYVAAASLNIRMQLDRIEEKLNQNSERMN